MQRGDVIVTGGRGFVGSRLTSILKSNGYIPHIIDKYNATPTSDINTDILDNAIRRHSINVRGIFHLAAISDINSVRSNPDDAYKINVEGTKKMLEFAIKHHIPKFIFSSSASVYGDVPISQQPIHEFTEKSPVSIYGLHKSLAEDICKFYNVKGKVQSVSLRYFNIFSMNNEKGVIYNILQSLKNDTEFTLRGDGNQTRDFIYIDDVVRANLKVLTTNKKLKGEFNIGSGIPKSINTLIDLVNKSLNQTMYINPGTISDEVRIKREKIKHDDEIRHSSANISKSWIELNWTPSQPKETLEYMIRVMVRNARLEAGNKSHIVHTYKKEE